MGAKLSACIPFCFTFYGMSKFMKKRRPINIPTIGGWYSDTIFSIEI